MGGTRKAKVRGWLACSCVSGGSGLRGYHVTATARTPYSLLEARVWDVTVNYFGFMPASAHHNRF